MTTDVLHRAARRILARTVFFAGLLGAGFAASAEERGWYAGITHDNTDTEVFRGFGWEIGPETSGFALQGGYRLRKHLAAGFAYRRANDLQWTEWSADVGDPLLNPYSAHTDFDARALQASVIGIATFASVWELYGKVGVSLYSLRGEQALTPWISESPVVTRHVSESGADMLLGFGIGVTVAPRWHLSMGYEYYEVEPSFLAVRYRDAASVDTFEIGAQYRFARRHSER